MLGYESMHELIDKYVCILNLSCRSIYIDRVENKLI